MTGDGHLRTLAAYFCASAVDGPPARVNNAIEILYRLLRAARDAGGNVDAVAEIAIEWKARAHSSVEMPDVPRLPDFEYWGKVSDHGKVLGGMFLDQELARFDGQWMRIVAWKAPP